METAIGVSRRSISLGAKKFAPILILERDRVRSQSLKDKDSTTGTVVQQRDRSKSVPTITKNGSDSRKASDEVSKGITPTPTVAKKSQEKEKKWCEIPDWLNDYWCYVILACSFLSNALIFGAMQSFSLYLDIWQNEFDTSKTTVTFIPSIAASMINLTSLLLPFALAAWSHRIVIVVGGIIATISAFIMTFSQYLALLFVTVAICYGGASMVYTPGVILTGEVFMQSGRRALGYSVVEAGSAVGPMALLPLLEFLKYVNTDENSLTNFTTNSTKTIESEPSLGSAFYPLLLIAILFCFIIFCGLFMRSADKTIDEEQEKNMWRKFSNQIFRKEDAADVERMLLSMAAVPLGQRTRYASWTDERRQSFLISAAKRDQETPTRRRTSLNPEVSFKSTKTRRSSLSGYTNKGFRKSIAGNSMTTIVEETIEELPEEELEPMEEDLKEIKKTTRFDFTVLKDLKFLLYIFYVCVHAGGMLTILILHVPYIQEAKKLTATESANIAAAMAGGDLAARILFSLAASNKKLATFSIYLFLIAEYLIFVILFSYSLIPEGAYTTQMVMSIFLGICRGTWAVNTWSVQSDVFGAENLSKVAGFSQFGAGIVILTVPPLVRLMNDVNNIPLMAGALIVLAAIILSVIIFYNKLQTLLKTIMPFRDESQDK